MACPRCGSGEYLYDEDGREQNYCGQCGQKIDWSRPPEGEEAEHKAKCGQEKVIACTVDGEPWCEDCFDRAME